MEETKNETAVEIQEPKESKKKVKSFKMNETQVERVNELLSKINGSTDAEKLIESLELAIKHTEVPELPSNLNKTYEGDREKISTALHMIHLTFESLMLSTSETIAIREAEIEVVHQFEVNKLMEKQEELENRIKVLQESASKSEDECRIAQVREVEMKKQVETIHLDVNLKNKTIEGLTKQLEETKEEMAQLKTESKVTITKKDAEIEELTMDSRKYKDKIEVLEAKNEELSTKITDYQQENRILTGKLSILEVNFENEKTKNIDLKVQLEKVQAELEIERRSKSELQSELLKLMSALTSQPKKQERTESRAVVSKTKSTKTKTEK